MISAVSPSAVFVSCSSPACQKNCFTLLDRFVDAAAAAHVAGPVEDGENLRVGGWMPDDSPAWSYAKHSSLEGRTLENRT